MCDSDCCCFFALPIVNPGCHSTRCLSKTFLACLVRYYDIIRSPYLASPMLLVKEKWDIVERIGLHHFFRVFFPFSSLTFYSRYSPTRENQDEILDKKNDHQIPVSILCAFLSPPMWLHRPMSTRVCLYLTVLQKVCVSDCAHERQQQANPKNQTNLSLKY